MEEKPITLGKTPWPNPLPPNGIVAHLIRLGAFLGGNVDLIVRVFEPYAWICRPCLGRQGMLCLDSLLSIEASGILVPR
jgi:hypothetical protein